MSDRSQEEKDSRESGSRHPMGILRYRPPNIVLAFTAVPLSNCSVTMQLHLVLVRVTALQCPIRLSGLSATVKCSTSYSPKCPTAALKSVAF